MNSADNPLLRPRNPFERRVVQAIAAAKPHLGVGVVERPLPGGVSLTVLKSHGRSALVIHPFFILSSGLLHAGTVNGQIPTLGASPIGEDGDAITLSGDKYIYIRAKFDLVFGAHHFLDSAVLTGSSPLTMVEDASPLVDALDVDAGELITYRFVAQIIAGKVQREQPTKTNLLVGVCDQSTGTEEGRGAAATWSTN